MHLIKSSCLPGRIPGYCTVNKAYFRPIVPPKPRPKVPPKPVLREPNIPIYQQYRVVQTPPPPPPQSFNNNKGYKDKFLLNKYNFRVS